MYAYSKKSCCHLIEGSCYHGNTCLSQGVKYGENRDSLVFFSVLIINMRSNEVLIEG